MLPVLLTVSIMATWQGNLDSGVVPNKVFPLLEGTPQQVVFTPNSDTPYAAAALDLTEGPMVVELPPGPLMCTSNDLNQRWVMDMGLPGPDAGKGGKHVLCGPGFNGEVPPDHYQGTATTNRVLMLLRALPHGDDMRGCDRPHAVDQGSSLSTPVRSRSRSKWVDLSKIVGADFTPIRWEDNLSYWQVLHDLIDAERPFAEYCNFYGELASLGHREGQAVRARRPDARHLDPSVTARETRSSGCSRSPTGDRTGKSGPAPPGNGRSSARKMAPSMPRTTPTTTPGRSGSTKLRSSPRPCSSDRQRLGPSTG